MFNGYNGICWYLCKMGSIRIPAPFWLIRMVWSCSGKCRHRTCNPFIVFDTQSLISSTCSSKFWMIDKSTGFMMQHLHLIPVCKSCAVNTNERSTWLSFLCNSFVVLHPIYWYCTYQLTFICSGTLPILKFFASAASGFFSTDLSKDWTPLHHTWKKEKKRFWKVVYKLPTI